MRLSERFKRLTIWNKIAVIGALASIAALPFALIAILGGNDIEPIDRVLNVEQSGDGVMNIVNTGAGSKIEFITRAVGMSTEKESA